MKNLEQPLGFVGKAIGIVVLLTAFAISAIPAIASYL
jgi:hypothetical protein